MEIDKNKVLELYNTGYTYEQISGHIGIGSTRIRNIIDDFRDSGVFVRDVIRGKRKLPKLPYAESTFEPRKANFAKVVENIKTPEIYIDGKRYIDVTQIICNSNEIEAMGKKFVGVRKHGKEKALR